MHQDPSISVVLPCFNEAGSIGPLLEEFRAVLSPMAMPFEIIVVDDGSTDDSVARLDALARTMPQLLVLRHSRNLGQSAALLSGYARARGEVVVTMDADGQNDPADMPAMFALLEDADAVCGIRKGRRDSGLKRFSSRVANAVRARVLGDGIHDAGCTFRAIRRNCLVQLPAFRGLHRFLPTILRIHGFRVVEMPVNHRARTSGESKYGVGNRLWVGIADMMAMRWFRGRHIPTDRLSKESR